jgi:hypothetical protein
MFGATSNNALFDSTRAWLDIAIGIWDYLEWKRAGARGAATFDIIEKKCQLLFVNGIIN